MTTWAVSMAMSFIIAGFLVALFVYEGKNGTRVAKNLRLHLDYYVLKTTHAATHLFRFVSSDLLRQVMHYTFHAVLGALLTTLKHFERNIHDIQRANRLRARASRSERTTRNKLDEIAEHKIAVALSDDEKKERRDKHLLGG